jgi:hypothetical protein
VLSSAARKVLSPIGPYLEDRHFYLGGGTALALYLVHRKSKDFDWFRKNPPVMIWSLDWKTVKKPSRPGFVNGMKKAAKPVTGKRLLLSPPPLCFP